MSEVVLTADNLTRYFGRKCAVDHVSFALPRGSITALLGRNGSGKTTLLRMLMGLLEPTGGRSTVLGQASGDLSPAARARIAYVAEGHPLYGWMKIRALAKHQAALYPRWNWDIYRRVIDHFQLDESAKAGRLSRGQTAGVSLAIALAPDPELLVLDDPSLGLDPVARRAMLQAIVELFGQGDRTILLSTHELQDVERIADRVLVLDQSVLLVDADKDYFLNHVAEYVIDGLPETDALTGGTPATGRSSSPIPSDLPKLPGVISVHRRGPRLHILTARRSAEALERLRLWGRPVEERSVSLEDAVIGYLSRRGVWGPSQGDVR